MNVVLKLLVKSIRTLLVLLMMVSKAMNIFESY